MRLDYQKWLLIAAITMSALSYSGCNKENISPEIANSKKVSSINGSTLKSLSVVTTTVSSITETSALCGGNVAVDAGEIITERGIKIEYGQTVRTSGGTGPFTCNIQNLTRNTSYRVLAYATDGVDTVYGDWLAFRTLSRLADGLVAYYPFNGNANDLSGNGNNGTVCGAVLTTNRKGTANSAYSFDGINDFIFVNNNEAICPISALSVSAWVNANGLAKRHCVVNKRIDYYTAPYDSYGLFASNATSSQSWMGTLTTNSTQTHVASPTVTLTNRWYHLVLTYNGNTESLYVDGVLVSSVIKTGPIKYSPMALYFGTSAQNTNYMKGKIDDIRIYNRALSSSEIQALYKE